MAKLDIIPVKSRKLTYAIFGLASILLLVFTGEVEGPAALETIWKVVAAFMAGNGVEHLAQFGKGKLAK